MTGSRLFTPAQVAEVLAIDVDSVMALAREGRVHAVRVGSPASWRIDAESVNAYLGEQAEDARRRALWHESQNASMPEVWGTPGTL
ncbi:helix-turn-helix domain-containing protein [Microbacterium halotolerans]|uniref:helix-turn-helix domain-containing protein n=1 Tax=Microbacterium halotolerans TaxID=246613 RepID=UPI000E6A9B95|nr:helix-turn-helix domain-containing protein [Microbacterium halotolerans]